MLKRTISTILTFAISVGLLVSYPIASLAAVDPSLALSHSCDSTVGASAMPTATIANEATDKYSGTGSIKVTQGSNWGGIVFPISSLEKDVKYRLSAYAKSLVCVGDPLKERVGISLWFKHNGTQVSLPWYSGTNANMTNKTTWRNVYADFTISSTTYPGTITELMFFATTANGATDQFLIDNVTASKSPVVSATVPLNAATNVSIVSDVDLTFNNFIDASTLNTTNITINNSATISSITPSTTEPNKAKVVLGLLQYNTQYTVTVQNVKDAYGVTVATKTIVFTTAKDTYSNMVSNPNCEETPVKHGAMGGSAVTLAVGMGRGGSGNAVQVAKASAYDGVTISGPIFESKKTYYISAWAKRVSGTANTINFAIQYKPGTASNKQLIMKNASGLSTGDWVQVTGNYYIDETETISNSLAYLYTSNPSEADTFLIDDIEIRELPANPIIVSTSPINGDGNIAVDSDMVVMFNNNVDENTLVKGTNILVNNSGSFIQSVSADVKDKKKVIIKFNGLLEGILYTVNFTGIKDIFGKTIADKTTSFTTKIDANPNLVADPGAEGATVNAKYAGSNATIAYSTEEKHSGLQSVKVTQNDKWGSLFVSVPMKNRGEYNITMWVKKHATTPASTINLCLQYKLDGVNKQSILKNYAINSTSFTELTFNKTIDEDGKISEVFVYLSTAGATNDVFYVDDLDVRLVEKPIAVSRTMPANGAVAVALNTDITVLTNGEMDLTTLTTANIKINGGTSDIASITTDENYKSRFIVTTNKPLKLLTTYTLTLSNLKDIKGVILPTYTMSFTTLTSNYNVDSFKLYKDFGTGTQTALPTDTLSEGVITAEGKFHNNTAQPIDAVACMALYNGNQLVEVNTQNFTNILAGSNVTFGTTVTVPPLGIGNYYIKVLFLNMLDNLKPLVNAVEVRDAYKAMSELASMTGGDDTRIIKAMQKAASGQNITIGTLGGSITEGAGSTAVSKRYASLVADWWEKTFPAITVNLVNVGIGSTDSYLGVHRAQENLLYTNPDFVVIDYGVNDAMNQSIVQQYEQTVKTVLNSANNPGVMLLYMMHNNGYNAQEWQVPIGNHYNVPMVSFRDGVWPQIQSGKITWESLYSQDIVHPNDKGHALVARFIDDRLDKIYEQLPQQAVTTVPDLPTVLHTPELYKNAVVLNSADVTPTLMDGWVVDTETDGFAPSWYRLFDAGWNVTEKNKPLKFTVNGKNIGIAYKKSNITTYGRVMVTIDNQNPVILDGFFENGWGNYPKGEVIANGLAEGAHTVEITLLDEHNALSTGDTFTVLGLLVSN